MGVRDWQIARQHTAEAIDKILEFMRGKVTGFEERVIKGKDGKSTTHLVPVEYSAPAALQLQAAGMLLERGWGKAPQALLVAEVNDEPTARAEVSALEVIRGRLAGIASRLEEGEDSPVVDAVAN